jgi:hypothetical protein
MITHAIAIVIGFIAGALTFRNNSAKAEKLVASAKEAALKIKNK